MAAIVTINNDPTYQIQNKWSDEARRKSAESRRRKMAAIGGATIGASSGIVGMAGALAGERKLAKTAGPLVKGRFLNGALSRAGKVGLVTGLAGVLGGSALGYGAMKLAQRKSQRSLEKGTKLTEGMVKKIQDPNTDAAEVLWGNPKWNGGRKVELS